jgi:predicted DCC family thiol-disulfide oxidoreductase YuxK
LIQLHLVFIYGMAGLAKLQGPAWWSGTALWGVLASAEFRQFDFTWLVAHPWLINLMTHGSLAFEISYPVLIWVRVLRPLMIVGAILLHAGIAVTAPGLTEFGLAMIAGNLAFVSGVALRNWVTGGAMPRGRVLYDGACPRCRASVALITAGDPARTIEPIDLTAVDVKTVHPSLTKDACMKAMHLIRADGKVKAGYDAVVGISRWVPLAWPFAIFGSLPGISAIGRRVYNQVAATRPRDVPCTDDVCGIHPHFAAAESERTTS